MIFGLAFADLDGIRTLEERRYDGVVTWGTRRYLEEETPANSSLILAEKRTHRKDPLDNFHRYNGGWNISNTHYWAVSLSSTLFFYFSSPGPLI